MYFAFIKIRCFILMSFAFIEIRCFILMSNKSLKCFLGDSYTLVLVRNNDTIIKTPESVF